MAFLSESKEYKLGVGLLVVMLLFMVALFVYIISTLASEKRKKRQRSLGRA